jgi:hypothetical protein
MSRFECRGVSAREQLRRIARITRFDSERCERVGITQRFRQRRIDGPSPAEQFADVVRLGEFASGGGPAAP